MQPRPANSVLVEKKRNGWHSQNSVKVGREVGIHEVGVKCQHGIFVLVLNQDIPSINIGQSGLCDTHAHQRIHGCELNPAASFMCRAP